jgi:ParB family transcriptional regulator, chromosome partitioning protein
MAKPTVPTVDYTVQFEPGNVKDATTEHNATARDLLMVPIDQISAPSNFNVRIQDADYEAHVEEIKQSIKENGFFTRFPLSCFVNKEGDQNFFQLVGGFTRFEAAKRAIADGFKIEKLPVVVQAKGTSMLDMMIALDRDNSGRRLKPYERAIVAKRSIGFGATEEEIAAKLSISKQYVGDLLYMMSLPKAVQTMVIEGKCSLGLAVQTARKEGASKAAAVLTAGLTAPASTGTGGKRGRPAGSTAPPRATGRSVGKATGTFKPNTRQLMGSIHYAIALPTADDGLAWLTRFISGDDDAVKELKSALRKAGKDGTPVPAEAKAKATGKGKGKGKAKPEDGDPLGANPVEEDTL